jgi:hypothetical protein
MLGTGSTLITRTPPQNRQRRFVLYGDTCHFSHESELGFALKDDVHRAYDAPPSPRVNRLGTVLRRSFEIDCDSADNVRFAVLLEQLSENPYKRCKS